MGRCWKSPSACWWKSIDSMTFSEGSTTLNVVKLLLCLCDYLHRRSKNIIYFHRRKFTIPVYSQSKQFLCNLKFLVGTLDAEMQPSFKGRRHAIRSIWLHSGLPSYATLEKLPQDSFWESRPSPIGSIGSVMAFLLVWVWRSLRLWAIVTGLVSKWTSIWTVHWASLLTNSETWID